jgi:hypothetical protein
MVGDGGAGALYFPRVSCLRYLNSYLKTEVTDSKRFLHAQRDFLVSLVSRFKGVPLLSLIF